MVWVWKKNFSWKTCTVSTLFVFGSYVIPIEKIDIQNYVQYLVANCKWIVFRNSFTGVSVDSKLLANMTVGGDNYQNSKPKVC